MITKDKAEYIFEKIALKNKTYKELEKEFNLNYTTLCRYMKTYKKEFGLAEDEKYSASAWLRYKYKDEIINEYQNGKSTKYIAEKYGFSDDHMIAKLLQSFGIKIRPSSHISRTDQSLFFNIATGAEAYTLGLITADGNVDKKCCTISVTLHKRDLYLLKELNQIICNGTGIVRENINKSTGYWRFCGKQISENLKKYGVVPRKTYSLSKIYQFENPVLMRHYIRGLFDGDGVCSKQCQYIRLGYCAHNKSFTQSFQDFMCNTLGLNRNKLFDTGGSWNCSWNARKDIEKIYDYLYKDATLYLDRKKQKIENFLYGNTEVTN